MTQIQRIGGVWRAVTKAQPEKTKANHHRGPICEHCHRSKPALWEMEIQPKSVWGPRTKKICISCMPGVLAEQRALAAREQRHRRRRVA